MRWHFTYQNHSNRMKQVGIRSPHVCPKNRSITRQKIYTQTTAHNLILFFVMQDSNMSVVHIKLTYT